MIDQDETARSAGEGAKESEREQESKRSVESGSGIGLVLEKGTRLRLRSIVGLKS